MTDVSNWTKKHLLKQVSEWVDDSISGNIAVYIEKGADDGPRSAEPLIAVSAVNLGRPTSTTERKQFTNNNGNNVEKQTQHFRGSTQLKAIGEGSEQELYRVAMLSHQESNSIDVSIQGFNFNSIQDLTEIDFEGAREYRAALQIPIRYKLTNTTDLDTKELKTADITLTTKV